MPFLRIGRAEGLRIGEGRAGPGSGLSLARPFLTGASVWHGGTARACPIRQ